MNKLRKAAIAGSILTVGTGVGAYEVSRPTASQRVAAAQHQILETAKQKEIRVNGQEAYVDGYVEADAKAIGEAKKLTARRVAKLSFNRAFDEASDVGGMVIDVSDMTGLPVKTVLNETLSKSTVTALEKRNIHFIYDSVEFNPMSMEAQDGHPSEGYIPLSFSDQPENIQVTRAVNGGVISGRKVAWSEYKTSNGSNVWGAVSGQTKPQPHINAYPLQQTFDGENVMLGAMVKPGKSGDHIESVSFSLVDPHNVPKGVSVKKSHMVNTGHGEEVVARFTDPSNLSLHGQVEVQVNAVESNGAVANAQEDIPYSKPPVRPSQ